MKDLYLRCAYALLLTAVAAPSLRAHCRLDSPNGGETLRAGSTYTIRWTETTPHGVRNWDLYYSTTGFRGPWLPLAIDLPPSARSYVWHVPDAISSRVRVRVVQDMISLQYDDFSDNDLSIVPSLAGSSSEVSVSKGGAQDLNIDAGSAQRRDSYLVIGSATGTAPGITFRGFPLHLILDGYTSFTLSAPNTPPLTASLGVLDGSGRATARFSLPPGSPPVLQGIQLYHVVLVFDTGSATLQLASNPVALTLGS